MDVIEVLPQLHMLRFRIGRAYLWRDGGELTLIEAGDADAGPASSGRSARDPARLRRIVLTHCHRDHTGAAGELAGRFGARGPAHRLDAPIVGGRAPAPEPVLLDGEPPCTSTPSRS
ncbi:MBL fold metallo-hydrolase [Streptomyces wuyuanensis]|uniref:MBL fold metallo-hydrolase n=1 Tax=Streptomyces wuyuanensis TaxID=1196353 RepID=UPI00367E51B5